MKTEEQFSIGETFTYVNIATKEEYNLGGLRDLSHAWEMVTWVAERKGWNVIDIMVRKNYKYLTGNLNQN